MRVLELETVESTNSYCKSRFPELEPPVAVRALAQTAGRGQRGNSWEAAPGKNLTFSILWQPEGVAPREQFALSEAVALGVKDYLDSRGVEAKVKWPNDIYVGDRKICGILIEHSVMGSVIDRTVAGVGINVNQEIFLSDAPNPVSLRQLTGKEYNLEEEMIAASSAIESRLSGAASEEGRGRNHLEFLASLWRGDGNCYPFRDMASGEIYKGRISDVEPGGMLVIEPEGGAEARRYAFKEVEFIL